MFVVVRIRKGAEIVKDWFGVRCAENLTLADLFEEFRSGSLDLYVYTNIYEDWFSSNP